MRTIAKFTNVHPRATAHMLKTFERDDVAVAVINFWYCI